MHGGEGGLAPAAGEQPRSRRPPPCRRGSHDILRCRNAQAARHEPLGGSSGTEGAWVEERVRGRAAGAACRRGVPGDAVESRGALFLGGAVFRQQDVMRLIGRNRLGSLQGASRISGFSPDRGATNPLVQPPLLGTRKGDAAGSCSANRMSSPSSSSPGCSLMDTLSTDLP